MRLPSPATREGILPADVALFAYNPSREVETCIRYTEFLIPILRCLPRPHTEGFHEVVTSMYSYTCQSENLLLHGNCSHSIYMRTSPLNRKDSRNGPADLYLRSENLHTSKTISIRHI
ncbi:hypothetical protein AVEN_233482-1 [Araneus ventricosus]|uniref:Uncharacterized protein n=1 Tax=Araneus ventricosus TaxID=182803 RepID=A0A4Y2TMV6_ARAVE|nr:hypothetical protein AVEN_233482-1 [Araneus ventricosus]